MALGLERPHAGIVIQIDHFPVLPEPGLGRM
jgi:hypothetical protein